MPITQDGSHKYGIPDSPIAINNVNYIAEDLSIEDPSEEAVIADDEGLELGRVIIPKSKRASGTLQMEATNTAIPPIGGTFVLNVNGSNTNFYLLSTTDQQTQGEFAKMAFTAVEQINS